MASQRDNHSAAAPRPPRRVSAKPLSAAKPKGQAPPPAYPPPGKAGAAEPPRRTAAPKPRADDRASAQPPARQAEATVPAPRRTAGPKPRAYDLAPVGDNAARADAFPTRPRRAGAGGRRTASSTGARPGARPAARPKRRRGRRVCATLLVLALALAAWPLGLAFWVNAHLQKVDALSPGGADTGRTYLVAGSDKRGSGGVRDATSGERADSILLVHMAENGRAFLVSIPRDTYVELEGHGGQKINAAYAFGGPKLLVQAVQQLSGLHVDHFVEVGFGSVTELVDAVGGVNLCLDQDVDDRDSKLQWQAGCHDADGALALAFSRMRKSDPLGDIGRAQRQRQVVGRIMGKALEPSLLWRPDRQLSLAKAGTEALTVDQDANIFNLGRLLLDFKAATGPQGVQGVPTIASMDYQPGGVGSAVLLDPEAAAEDFRQIADGTWAGNQG